MDGSENGNYAAKIGDVVFAYGQYVLSCPQFNLEVRGKHIEWVFLAASEVITEISKIKDQNDLDSLIFTAEDDDSAVDNEIRQELLRFKMENRYDTVPQCGITFDGEDYRWIAEWARTAAQAPFIERLFSPAMMNGKGTSRVDVPDVENLPDLPVDAAAGR